MRRMRTSSLKRRFTGGSGRPAGVYALQRGNRGSFVRFAAMANGSDIDDSLVVIDRERLITSRYSAT